MRMSFKPIAIGSAIILGIGVSLCGFLNTKWTGANWKIWFSMIAGLAVVSAFSRFLNKSPFFVGVVACFAIALVSGAFWPLLVLFWFALASALLGKFVLSRLKYDDAGNWIVHFLVGTGLYGTLVGLLAHFPINYPGVYGAMLIAPLILQRDTLHRWLATAKQWSLQTRPIGGLNSGLLDVFIAAIALVHFTVALMPEIGHDALAMHLFIPGHMAHSHKWGFDVTTYVWAVMPMLGDWIFSIGYMLGEETAVRLINVGFIFVLGWLIRDVVIWAGGSAMGARWAALIFLTTPLTFTESSSLFIESIWASFVVAGSLYVFKSTQKGSVRNAYLPIAGFLLGAALAAKAVTLSILPVLFLLLVIHYRAWLQKSLFRDIFIGLVLFCALGAIPYLTAWYLTGNPVFPFFNKIFQSPFWPPVNFEATAFFGKGVAWDIFYKATFHTGKFLESRPGATGMQWLLLYLPALIALLFARQRRGLAVLIVASLAIAMVFQSVTYLRYVFPLFALATAAMGVALSPSVVSSPIIERSLHGVGWIVVISNMLLFNSGTYYGNLSLKPLLSASDREVYLQKHLPIRNAVELVNKLNQAQAPVAVFSAPLTAGLKADGLYPNWYNHQFKKQLDESNTPQEISGLMSERGVYYIILDENWGNTDKRKVIEAVTNKIAGFGHVAVRVIKSEYLFQTELVRNANFFPIQSWTVSPGVEVLPDGGVTVSVHSPAYQIVPVTKKRHYLYSVLAACANQSGKGRLQINWLDKKSNFISTDIRVFECTPSVAPHSMEVVSPDNASHAVVYASGHADTPIIFRQVSLKK